MIRPITRLVGSCCTRVHRLFIAGRSAGVGIKFGPTFATFSSDALDFDNRTGIHAGLFVGGSRDKVVGLQTEFNWLRKKARPKRDSRSESTTSRFRCCCG